MDITFIKELRVETVIGIYDWEREIRQTVVIDLEMGGDIRAAATTDNIADAIDYKAVGKRLIAFVEEAEFQLVETLAERLAEIVCSEFNVPWLRLTINKEKALTGAAGVGVTIERGHRAWP